MMNTYLTSMLRHKCNLYINYISINPRICQTTPETVIYRLLETLISTPESVIIHKGYSNNTLSCIYSAS